MPVSPHTHHHSIFSSLRHALKSSAHPNPSADGQHHLQLYQTFESNLAHRLSSLSSSEDFPCVNMASLKQFLHVLLATQADLKPLIPIHQFPLSESQVRMMEEFLDRSIKLLDVCREIKEQISDVESFQVLLRAAVSCLSAKSGGVLHLGQVVRARKALAELLLHMEIENVEEPPVHMYRSFRCRRRGNGAGESGSDATQRRRSWHGSAHFSGLSSGSNSPALQPSRQLRALASVLSIPRVAAGDVEESLCAAIYALNVISIFFLGTLTASLPSLSTAYVPRFAHPRSFAWAAPLSHLQERVQEELKRQNRKSSSFAGLWDLDQIATIVRLLFELTEDEDGVLGEKTREEIKNLTKQLKQHVEELERDLGQLYTELMDFYNCIISSRMEIMDILSNFRP